MTALSSGESIEELEARRDQSDAAARALASVARAVAEESTVDRMRAECHAILERAKSRQVAL